MSARQDDNFRQMLRALPMRRATPRVVDLSFPVSLSWPERHWYEPQTFDQVAAQEAVRSARVQKLPDRIENPSAVGRLAVLWRKR
jgi:hypothetical protein